MERRVLWWGRFDPDYSRNRVIRNAFRKLGWVIDDFFPRISSLGNLTAGVGRKRPDLVWVPCFRQRDILAAHRWATKNRIPLIFDPLISAYDKQVYERNKFAVDSSRAKKLLNQERRQFGAADLLIADTRAHADYFSAEFHVSSHQVHVIPVGAEDEYFRPCQRLPRAAGEMLEVLFYGSFIHLHGMEVIIEAARLCQAENLVWTMLGAGPLLDECKQLANKYQLSNLRFEPWIPYPDLPQRICRADILLGVFSSSAKAGRVIPNKVYQPLACGRPVITRNSAAYPSELAMDFPGLQQISPDDPAQLAKAVERLAGDAGLLDKATQGARCIYDDHFSNAAVMNALEAALRQLFD